MNLKIDQKIHESYPYLRIGVVIATNIQNANSNDELETLKRKAEINLRSRFPSAKELRTDTQINGWRETYRSFGVSPKKKPPTAEKLATRILREGRIPTINVAVDSYLVAEMETLLPTGGYDLDQINGDIVLTYSSGEEDFEPLGGGTEQTNEGEVIYRDNSRILTRRWNYKDTESTKITEETKNLALFTEIAHESHDYNILVKQTERIAELVRKFCGGEVKFFIVDPSSTLVWKII